MCKFAMIGTAGYIARKHIECIKEIKGELVGSYDISDSVGILELFPECLHFTDKKAFKSFLEETEIDYLVICSPNLFHFEHILLGLETGSSVICEKPLVLTRDHYNTLLNDPVSAKNVYPVLQFRYADFNRSNNEMHLMISKYIVKRGNWYQGTWKNDIKKSGGINFNIGAHLFDLANMHLGECIQVRYYDGGETDSIGSAEMEFGMFQWYLAITKDFQERSIWIDGMHTNLDTFKSLHLNFYRSILHGTARPLMGMNDTMDLLFKIEEFKK